MAQPQPLPGPPTTNPRAPNKSPLPLTINPQLGTNPGLITSTGGLFGVNGVLLTPVINLTTRSSYILLMDSNNFDCEDDGEYDFPQEIPPRNAPQEGRDVSCHLIILKYREIGIAQFTINITTFEKETDSFTSYPYVVNIPPKPLTKARMQTFPDGRIHTQRIPIQVPGERPQVTINFKGKSGPHCITSLVLCGNADEIAQI